MIMEGDLRPPAWRGACTGHISSSWVQPRVAWMLPIRLEPVKSTMAIPATAGMPGLGEKGQVPELHKGERTMGKVLELSEETYQQFTALAERQHRTPEELLRLCLLAYEQYQHHLVHQQMVVEGLLEGIPLLLPLDAEDDDFEPAVIPGKPLSEIILEDRR